MPANGLLRVISLPAEPTARSKGLEIRPSWTVASQIFRFLLLVMHVFGATVCVFRDVQVDSARSCPFLPSGMVGLVVGSYS